MKTRKLSRKTSLLQLPSISLKKEALDVKRVPWKKAALGVSRGKIGGKWQ
jgi:hypothetical protein